MLITLRVAQAYNFTKAIHSGYWRSLHPYDTMGYGAFSNIVFFFNHGENDKHNSSSEDHH